MFFFSPKEKINKIEIESKYCLKSHINLNKNIDDIYEPSYLAYIVSFIQLAAELSKIDFKINIQEIDCFTSFFPLSSTQKKELELLFIEASYVQNDPLIAATKICYLFPKNTILFKETVLALIKLAICDDYLNIYESSLLLNIAAIFSISNSLLAIYIKEVILSTKIDPQELLSLNIKVEKTRLNKFYKKLLKQNHPDRFIYAPDIAIEFIGPLNEYFQLLNHAYQDFKLRSKI